MLDFKSFADFFTQHYVLFELSILVFGICIGSFLNVVIYRLPLMLYTGEAVEGDHRDTATDLGSANGEKFNLAVPRSFCTQCRAQLSWFDNIPVLSYLLLKGKCRSCLFPISVKYPSVEVLSGIFTLILGLYFGCSVKFLLSCIFIYALIVLCFIDLNTFLLPDCITLPLIWCGLIVNSYGVFTSLKASLFGAVFGYLVLWAVFWIFKAITRKNGFGYGDFKLLAAIGAWLGWVSLPLVIFISTLTGSIVGLSLLALKKIEKDSPIPFGPYLILGGVIMLLYPDLVHFLY